MQNKLGILSAIVLVGLAWPDGACGQANQPAPASVIELPYPYELGGTYEVTKVDPGGMAQIVEVGPWAESELAKAKAAAGGPDPIQAPKAKLSALDLLSLTFRGRGRPIPAPKAKRPEPSLTEGHYLMLVRPLVDGDEPRLLRVETVGVGAKESTLQLGKAGAAMVRTGDRCSMIRPQNTTAAQLRALPEVIPFTARREKSKSPTALLQARTLSNLSKIGLALNQFVSVHICWPPAVLVGPDGKPWHSWRVLLLPLLGYRDLFDQYDFSQPWDSAKNLRLLDKMPAVYHDPIYGDKLGHFTHYAALVGGGPGPKLAGSNQPVETAFSASGVKMENVTVLPLERPSERNVIYGPNGETSIRTPQILRFHVFDTPIAGIKSFIGAPYTIVVAAVSPNQKVPWTKPEDITVGPGFPLELGKPGGIAAPYSFDKSPTLHRAAPVLFADGQSSALLDTIDPSELFGLLTVGAGEPIQWSKVPEARFAAYTRPHFTKLVVDCESGRATISEPTLIESFAPARPVEPTPRPESNSSRPRAPSVIHLPYPYELGSTYEVTKVDPGGTAQIVEVGPSSEIKWATAKAEGGAPGPIPAPKAKLPEPALTPGDYLMLVRPLVEGGEPRLFRAQVHVVGDKQATVQLGEAGAAKLRAGDRCSMIRPRRVTVEQLRALPEVIPITAQEEKSKSPTAGLQAKTLANLSRIGEALRQFEMAHQFWPPAFLVGPDGKPWHSWRVLLLPYLGHRDLFDQYDFSQPWDSARNLRLLDKMPAVYHDPIYGENLGHATHYAALVGSSWLLQTVFCGSGAKMNDVTILPLERLSEQDVFGRGNGIQEARSRSPILIWHTETNTIAQFLLGRSNPIVVAAVSPERKIPWTKPEDITVGLKFPLKLGQPGGIAAPYSFGKSPTIHRAAPVLFADGTSRAILDTIDPRTLFAFLTRSGRQSIGWTNLPEARFTIYSDPSFITELVIDCASGRATIAEPTLIETREPPRPVARPFGPPPIPEEPPPKDTSVIELPYPHELGSTYEVTKVDPRGTAQIVEVGPSPQSEWADDQPPSGLRIYMLPHWWTLKANEVQLLVLGGPCLMLVKPVVDGRAPRLFRVEVKAVGENEWTVQLGKDGAAKVRTGDRCSLIPPVLTQEEFRFLYPLGHLGYFSRDIWLQQYGELPLTEDEVRDFPQVIPIDLARNEKPRAPESLQQARTLANLSAIGRAIDGFSHGNSFRPPAFLVGHDGKPWHSWRVLLLPYLGHRDLFDQYDFSQPWDSAKNLRLLDKMPAVYHDPIYGDEIGHLTHYAALLHDGPGPELAGARPRIWGATTLAARPMNGATIWPLMRQTHNDMNLTPRILSDRIPREGVTTSGCLIVAAVSPERKIPWTKPEDITVGPEFPLQLGQPGGIAAPYSSGRAPHLHRAAPVLFDDGKSSAIVDTIDPSVFRAIVGGKGVDRLSQVPVARFAAYRSPPFPKLQIYFHKHRATVTQPELIEPGAYTGAAQIELPYPYELGWTYEVTKVDPGGTARIVRSGPRSAMKRPKDAALPRDPFPVDQKQKLLDETEAMLVEGLHLMLVQPLAGSSEPRLLRVEVSAVGAKEWTVQLGKAGAAKLRTGDRCSMIRPQNVTAGQLRALPEVIPFTAEKEKNNSPTARLLARSLSNLSHIGFALYRSGGVPPAFLVGPDGKPWHSWRVLLLPYLGHRDLFDQYDFSQPWDSPKNLRLLDKMPADYHDPIYGDRLGPFTHYAALVGGGPGPKLGASNPPVQTAFSASGVKMNNVTLLPLERLTERAVEKTPSGDIWVPTPLAIRFEHGNLGAAGIEFLCIDGAGGTILLAAVSPDRKIPWTKPEDITVGPEFPRQLGLPGGIAAPYPFGKSPTIHRAAPVLFADRVSSALLDTIDPSELFGLLTPAGGETISSTCHGARIGGYYWSHFPKLVIDCESGRATITEPSQAIGPRSEINRTDELPPRTP
jgi:hypothetical protein